MAPRSPEGLTPLELEIMKVLWTAGPAGVQPVREALAPRRKLAYTTVQTMLNVLWRKGRVRRTLKDRAYVYYPVLTRRRALRHAVGDMVERLFGGSAESLVVSLVESRHITPEALARLTRALERAEKDDDGDR
ncbi:MAG TPA: BlaI/MecI/CopY family transcriptional regulator [Thermoanaerobaculia bacterium]|jgi:predicted transcriptional regulator|nr:BlaI/MecI/CopY family transcriptional regulator [Thermoanaerobaculia bacterium]